MLTQDDEVYDFSIDPPLQSNPLSSDTIETTPEEEIHIKLIQQIESGLEQLTLKVFDKDIYEQLELFQYKFPEIERDELTEHLHKFQKYSKSETSISETDAMRLLRLSAVELWTKFRTMRENKANRRLEFLEYLCGLYDKSFAELNELKFNATIQEALLEVRSACLEAREVEERLIALDETENESKAAYEAKCTEELIINPKKKPAAYRKPIGFDREREKLVKIVSNAKEKEMTTLMAASKIIDDEIEKVDFEERAMYSGIIAEQDLKDKLSEEKKARDARKLEIQRKWERPNSTPLHPKASSSHSSSHGFNKSSPPKGGGDNAGDETISPSLLRSGSYDKLLELAEENNEFTDNKSIMKST